MKKSIEFTQEEVNFRKSNSATYNSGRVAEAYNDATEFYKKNPESVVAIYCYGVMAGDYASSDVLMPKERKEELYQIAKTHIKKLYELKNLDSYSDKFVKSVKNEYFWFFEQHEEQYNLGVQENRDENDTGWYSMCVGASMMALNLLTQENKLSQAQDWAQRSIDAFVQFEKISPDWFNINYFASQSFAILGDFEKSRANFLEMFKKQKSEVNKDQYNDFEQKLEEIRIALTRRTTDQEA